jgi:peptidoglycan-associated lipoprotein
MQGGYGDLDIWYAQRSSTSNGFDPPVNLGNVINTPNKESWPFLRNDTSLYFASTGHNSIGGYDIFRSVKQNATWQQPENMQSPINSSADDFGIIFSKKADEAGFFSSNRSGGIGGDDIYQFDLPSIRFSISGLVKDELTMQPLAGAVIQILGSDGLNIQTSTDKKGFYRFDETQIRKDVTYKMWSSAPKYFEQEVIETTVGLENSKDIVRDFKMPPIPREPIVLPDILYDLGKWELKERYQDSLMGLIQLLENNPRLVIELASHTDSRPIAMTNDSLSQYRAQEVVKYLILRGINPGRLIAKGYGSQKPREINKERVLYEGRDSFVIPELTVLTEDYIHTMPPKFQEQAHSANRRTEFSIIRDDFIPPVDVNNNATFVETKIENLVKKGDVDEDKKIHFKINPNGKPEINIVVNGVSSSFVYDSIAKTNSISWDAAMRLLKTGKINKNDFTKKEESFNDEGDVILGSEVVLHTIKINDVTLKNIKTIVGEEMPAPLILNKDALKALGEYSINLDERYILLNNK